MEKLLKHKNIIWAASLVILIIPVIAFAVSTSNSMKNNNLGSSNESSALLGQWVLTSLVTDSQEVSAISGNRSEIEFKVDGTLDGQICNSFGTTYEVKGENFEIQIGDAVSTRMFCSDPEGLMEQEGIVLASLNKISSYELSDNSLKLIVDPNNSLTFTKIN